MNNPLNEVIILENDIARLEPLEEKHFELLLPVALHIELWEFTGAYITNEETFRRYFNTALKEKAEGLSYPFAIYDKRINEYVGSTRYANISLPNKRLEIGWTWYHPKVHRSGINKNCKFLLLSFGFNTLDLNRIELKTSHLNVRSQGAMLKIGAVKEGTLRRHSINDNGVVRDTVYFSFIKEDWPGIRETIFGEF